MELHLKGRVALITGPAKGMGAAVTRAFAAEGCRLALLGRDVAAIEPVAAEVRAKGIEAIVLPCDITDGAACDAAVAATQKAFGGRIDILVNVAGGSGRSARRAGRRPRRSSTRSSISTCAAASTR